MVLYVNALVHDWFGVSVELAHAKLELTYVALPDNTFILANWVADAGNVIAVLPILVITTLIVVAFGIFNGLGLNVTCKLGPADISFHCTGVVIVIAEPEFIVEYETLILPLPSAATTLKVIVQKFPGINTPLQLDNNVSEVAEVVIPVALSVPTL